MPLIRLVRPVRWPNRADRALGSPGTENTRLVVTPGGIQTHITLDGETLLCNTSHVHEMTDAPERAGHRVTCKVCHERAVGYVNRFLVWTRRP